MGKAFASIALGDCSILPHWRDSIFIAFRQAKTPIIASASFAGTGRARQYQQEKQTAYHVSSKALDT